jgi:hypothetical protein
MSVTDALEARWTAVAMAWETLWLAHPGLGASAVVQAVVSQAPTPS